MNFKYRVKIANMLFTCKALEIKGYGEFSCEILWR